MTIKQNAVSTLAGQAQEYWHEVSDSARRRLHEGAPFAGETIRWSEEEFYVALDAIADILTYMNRFTFAESQVAWRRGDQ